MTQPEDQASAGPVRSADRIEALDVLRGFALLGIFVMNITGMAFPFAAYFNPMVYGGPKGLNFAAWVFSHTFFELKFMALFSMLFGAGVVLMAERAEAAGRAFGRIYYRRIFWLLAIGLIHAYLVWHGDILVTYALCGFLLFLFRRRKVRTLLVWGSCFLLVGSLLSVGGGFAQTQLRNVVQEIESKVAAGQEMTPHRQGLIDQWEDLRHYFAPSPEEIEATIATMRGAPGDVLRANAREAAFIHTQAVPFNLFWRAMALMLLGMALFKAGVLTGERTAAFYRRWASAGFLLGLPIIGYGIRQWQLHGFDFVASFLVDSQYNYFASLLVAMAYIAIVMLVCRSGRLPGLRRRLAAVGRMALTNYLLQSVIGVLLFYGYGLALFGRFSRSDLWAFILAVWALQLAVSPWWLERFRFGPAEWLWRSLTYWRRQPMRTS